MMGRSSRVPLKVHYGIHSF